MSRPSRPRLSRRAMIGVLVAVFVGLVVFRYIVGLYGPQNPNLYFTPSRQQAFTELSTKLLSCPDYTQLKAVKRFASREVEFTTDGTMPEGWKEMIVAFMRRNRLDYLCVDRPSRSVTWSYLLWRMPFFYKFSPDPARIELPTSARSVQSLGSNWVYYVLSGP